MPVHKALTLLQRLRLVRGFRAGLVARDQKLRLGFRRFRRVAFDLGGLRQFLDHLANGLLRMIILDIDEMSISG